MSPKSSLPPFEDLPIKKDGPPFNAWGLYGNDDELGRLNLITPEAVKRGVEAVKHGVTVNVNLPLITRVGLRDLQSKHDIIKGERSIDDVLMFNTQTSTQWDGLRHFGYVDWPNKGDRTHYNGMSSQDCANPSIKTMGVQNYVRRPITAKGHLLDIPRYLSSNNLPALTHGPNAKGITVEQLEGCIKFQGNNVQPGDILCLKTGWTEITLALSEEERKGKKMEYDTGVKRGEDMLKWHWEKGWSAVATDGRAYEQFPIDGPGPWCHEVFLGGWGMPIGEFFDFRELAQKCEELGQYEFLFTSMALYVEGGIASPPNAQAIL